jgi:hypothetical protein
MLSSGRFTTRYFLSIAVIFVFIVVDSFLRFSASFPPREIVFYSSRDGLIDFHILAFNLVLLVFSSPPLLSLLLLRRPSFARTPPRGVRSLHTRRTASDAELLATAPVGGFRRRPCRRVAGGDGGRQVGEMGLLRRAPVLAFPRSHALDLLRSYAHLIAFRRQHPLV